MSPLLAALAALLTTTHALQPQRPPRAPVDAFELAAAEALKDELAGGLQKRTAAERVQKLEAAEALDAAQSLDALETALVLADAAGVSSDAPEVVAALARRDRALATLEREAVLETLAGATDCEPEACDVYEIQGLVDEAKYLGIDTSAALAKSKAALAAKGLDDGRLAAAVIFRKEADPFYDA
eukprot:CAMPEP_0119275218 /NCGR_PEP_ID=MMETSP1329-20130426/13462_1 /TAXON_ID=114041 /ORGANISM="Genus nov. species nov., Strain RCC1024" /LENGTH=183 /DNA_ID=CAMNT_0007275585 /DNA_START=109 /DNA_END=656 /DNA_ORIENTATION=+